jgi:hypothetical protein
MEPESGLLDQLKSLIQPGKSADDFDRLKKMLEFIQEVKEQCRKEDGGTPIGFPGHETERKRMELEHIERMKALEAGQPFLDPGEIAKARSAIRAAGTIGVLVPLAVIGAAVGVTAMIFSNSWDIERRVEYLGIVWAIAGILSLVTVVMSVGFLSRRSSPTIPSEALAFRRSHFPDSASNAFTDRPSNH